MNREGLQVSTTLTIALGFALALPGFILLGDVGGTARPWEWYLFLSVSTFGTALGVAAGWRGGLASVMMFLEVAKEWRTTFPPAPTPAQDYDGPADPAPLSPFVDGGMLDEWESVHRERLLLFLAHARRVGSLKSTDLVGPGLAVSRAESWAYYVDILVASGLAVKRENGVATERGPNMTWTLIVRRVTNMQIELPVQYKGSPLPPVVAPLPALMPGNVKLEKA